MIFVDASAIISIIAGEEDAEELTLRLTGAGDIYVSGIVIYEAVAGLARKRACGIAEAERFVDIFIEETKAATIVIDADVAREALRAFDVFGRPGHRARLNLGDCFAYACTAVHGLKLLFKGDDFGHTDIDRA